MNGDVVVILNPASGRGRGARARDAIERRLAANGGRLIVTTHAGEAKELAAHAAREGARLVAAAGGDGTLGEVLGGIANTGCELGLIPLGTGNDFARATGVPRDAMRSLDLLWEGTPIAIDYGTCGSVAFINACGCGFDAAVAERINRGVGWATGTAAYLAAVVLTLARFRPARVRVEIDGVGASLDAMLVAVANGTSYGGGMRIAPKASPRDGLLDVVAIEAMGRGEFVRNFASVFRGEHIRHPKVRTWRGAEVRVASEPEWPVLADGEVVSRTPVAFGVRKGGVVMRLA